MKPRISAKWFTEDGVKVIKWSSNNGRRWYSRIEYAYRMAL